MQTTEARAKDLRSVQQVMVRRKRVVLPPESGQSAGKPAAQQFLAAFVQNLESVGYQPSQSFLLLLESLSLEQLDEMNDWLMPCLNEMRGSRPFQPMYPNFPREVMDANKAQLYINALRHYLTNGKWLPPTIKTDRPPLEERGNLQTLRLGTMDELHTEFVRLITANSSTSAGDKEHVAAMVKYLGADTFPLIPPTIPHRENKAHLVALLLPYGIAGESAARTHCDTVTDVLRVACAMSGGDVSLAKPTKFRSFTRQERRLLLQLLNDQSDLGEEMMRWQEPWKRLGERLHPFEFRRRYPNCAQAFEVIRNDLPVQRFNTQVEAALTRRDTEAAVALLRQRPGELARRLDHLLRICPPNRSTGITDAFRAVARNVSTPVLVQVMHHFSEREKHPSALRVFLPKGTVSKAQVIPFTLASLPGTTCDAVIDICREALIARFSKLPPLGKCYLDHALSDFAIPFSQRSAAKALRTIARGSHLSLPDTDTLRFFIWWKNGTGRTDLDLSAALFRDDFSHYTTVAYYNLKDFGGHHSGDIVDAPEGASEFIDLSISRCREVDVRYIMMCVNSFTAQPYCDLPECFAGWMAREEPNSGEVYDPRTVEDRLDLAANTRIAIPAIFDLKTREVVWLDLSLTGLPQFANNVHNNMPNIQLMLKAFVQRRWASLHTLLQLHVQARGQQVDSPSDADVVFSVQNETPFQIERILSEFLSN